MKGYEAVSKTSLVSRTPVAIRIDGKAFHTLTRGFDKPFDNILHNAMCATMKYLCENIEHCVVGYTQSDEISLIMCDYATLTSEGWFSNAVQKMASVSASMATMIFNKVFAEEVYALDEDKRGAYFEKNGSIKLAMFDSRAFNLPEAEVNNYLLWRQQDATRNSIQMVAQANFKHKELHGKSCDELQELLFSERGINWNNYPVPFKRGTCCIKVPREVRPGVVRNKWELDGNIPIFSADRDYIGNILEAVRKEK